MTLAFFAAGVPTPQGSSKGFVVKDKRTGKLRAIVTSDNAKLKPWRWTVQYAARLAMEQAGLAGQLLAECPVHIDARFIMPAPKWVQAKQRKGHVPPCIKKPDLDKLARGLLDALTGIVFQDDALVMDLHPTKHYAQPGEEPGVRVLVTTQFTQTTEAQALPLDQADDEPPPPEDLDDRPW